MKFTIQRKLTLGVGIQFLLLVVSVAAGIAAVRLLTADTDNILHANYDSIEYCRHMGEAVDDAAHPTQAIALFQENLHKQQRNVTEPGEQELTQQLAADFEAFQTNPNDAGNQSAIRKQLNGIIELNMKSILRKSEVARGTARTASIMMASVGTLSLIIALTLLINLPSSIAEPIREFAASIKQIGQKNYAWRIDASRSDEFGELALSFNTMAAKLQDYESSNVSRMLFEKKRIEALINNMYNPVIGLSEERIVLFANHAALRVLHLQADQVVGRSAPEIAQQHDLLRTLIQDLDAGTDSTAGAKALPIKIFADGKESFFDKEVVRVTVTPTGESAENYIGDVIILQNITPFKELDAAKTNFIATVSHEFKTPIAAIQMSLQLLQNPRVGTLNGEQDGLVQSMKEDADRLLRITSELLDLTQVESGQIQLNILPVAVAEIVDYAIAATRVQAEQKQVQVEVALADAGISVHADSEKTAWVLTNLISNAIRYSYEHATVRVGGNLIDGRLRLNVQDTGQGIAPQYQAKIFERYFRVPGTMKEGTGLGLAISKEFIEAQGGRIGMESELGVGSTFWVELELAPTRS